MEYNVSMAEETRPRLAQLQTRWEELLNEAGPQHMKTMAEALVLIRQMEQEDQLGGKKEDPFSKFSDRDIEVTE